MFGEKEVLAAAGKVLHTPKNSMGGLAKRADVAIGPYFMAPHPSPYLLFLTEVTNVHRETMRSRSASIVRPEGSFYQGEVGRRFLGLQPADRQVWRSERIAAAARVKGAPKDSEGRLKGDPQYNGQTYWFETLLKDPKAALPDAVPHFRASSYDPRWLGKNGGGARHCFPGGSGTGVAPQSRQPFISRSPGAVMGFSPHSDMLQETYGENFAGLVGKAVEVYGEVDQWRGGAGVRHR